MDDQTTTWNPSDKSAQITLSNGNLTATNGSGVSVVRATTGQTAITALERELRAAADDAMGRGRRSGETASYWVGVANAYRAVIHTHIPTALKESDHAE